MYLIRYDEIMLKGKNRSIFEGKLMSNINKKIKYHLTTTKSERKIAPVVKMFGKLMLHVEEELARIDEILSFTPGLIYFAFVQKVERDITTMSEYILANFPTQTKSFKIETRRSDKSFALTSMTINQQIGDAVIQKHSIAVNLKKPETIVFISIDNTHAYIYFTKKSGLGGLPVGSSGRVISLLSGGIDSPVASAMMMNRGGEIVAFHAYNHTLRPKSLEDKIFKLTKQLEKIQGSLQLIIIQYKPIQKEIVEHIPAPYRMIAFKRSIVRVANLLAQKLHAKAIINGDSLGQVASQTMENIQCVHDVSNLPILSPLIGMQKQEIITRAKHIGTYDISILPYDDCCSLIATKNPQTRGIKQKIQEMEKKTQLLHIEEQLVILALEK